ncbi:unnamed protein product [Angiostrongylus costaricensis]|uniref:DUF3730 domain-containing protein n=1 Tax=Angiostrongylus costaricensis TaxID=334426 RepID=A0A0R3PXS3_ANGCS|nr:unnamed protein product [Angiostrongylus costaricensis]
MSEFSVRRLHPFLEQLVLCQRANRDVRDILTTIKKIIDGRPSCSVTKEEQLACEAAILVALRVTSCTVFRIILGEKVPITCNVGAESSMTTGKWGNDRTGYAAVVHACLSLHENDSDQPNLGIVKFSHIHALFSALMSNMEGPSSSILIMLQAVYDLCRMFSRINEWRNEFTSVKCVGLYGKVVSVCLEVASDKENDMKCRQLALMSLESVINISENGGDSLPIVLPGLSSTLVSISCATNENFDIVIACLKMFSKVIPICLCDGLHDNDDVSVPSDLKPEIRQLLIQRNSEWKADTIKNVIKMLANILSYLNEDVSRLAISRSPVLRSIFPALAASLKVDLRRLLITRGQFGGSSLEFIKLLPFSFGIDICSILPVCSVLADYGGVEYCVRPAWRNVGDKTFFLQKSGSIAQQCPHHMENLVVPIPFFFLAELKFLDDPYVLLSLAETCIEWISEFRPKGHARDDIIECRIPVATNETVLVIGLVSLLAITFTKITEEKKQLKLLIDFLYQLLRLYAIPNWILHDAADCALNEISSAFSLSVSEFLCERGSYLIHQIALAAKSRAEHDHAPIVLSVLLNRVDNEQMYHHVRHIVEDLLQALDKFMQEYCILILRSMFSFVCAVGRKYSYAPVLFAFWDEPGSDDGKLLSEEQAIMEIQKAPPPLPITSVENVLLRTTHLLSSSLLPIRILVLKILYEGLWVMRNFDDSLLPTIHRNWEALIHRFSDQEFEVRQECVKVVAQMVKVSKTFVYRRVRYQMWPLMEKWLSNESTRNYSPVSSAYKYQLLLIESCADIWIGINALTADVELLLKVLRLYDRDSTNTQLKLAAAKAIGRLEVYLEGRKQ